MTNAEALFTILEYIAATTGHISIQDLIDITGRSRRSVQRDLKTLTKVDAIRRTGRAAYEITQRFRHIICDDPNMKAVR